MTSQDTLKYILYARKSTDDDPKKKKKTGRIKQVLSINSQLTELRQSAKQHNLYIMEEITEHRTAKTPGRPEFNRMMKLLAAGKADGILAWHPDRLARNSKDGGEVIHQIDQGTVKDLKFPTYTFENSPQGKFMLYLTFAQSKLYVDNMSANTARNHREKMRRGEWPFPAPIGYRSKSCKVEIHPAYGPLIAKAFRLYAEGAHAITDIRVFLNNAGLRTRFGNSLALSHCQSILRNPFYYGLMRHKGELHPGKHPRLITKSIFDRVQAEMARRSKPNVRRLKPYIYRGMFHCGECGCVVTMETQKGINYLRCTKRIRACSQPYLREDALQDQLEKALERIMLPKKVMTVFEKVLEQKRAEIKRINQDTVDELVRERNELEMRKDKLLDLALTEDIFSKDEYRSKANRLTEQIVSLSEKIQATERNGGQRFEPWFDLEKGLNEAIVLKAEENPEKIRDFLKNTGSNFIIYNRRAEVELKKRWKTVADWKTRLASCGPNPPMGRLVKLVCLLLDVVRTDLRPSAAS